jgi:hypothetical protein
LVYRDYIDDTTPYWNNKLWQYAQSSYEGTHKFFVDNSVDLQYIDDNTTYLVGSLRKGGRGIYALNVKGIKDKTAEANAANIVAWEYPKARYDGIDNDNDGSVDNAGEVYDPTSMATHTDPYMGFSFSRAQITKVHTTTGFRWVVIFGNGYESYNNVPALYILDLETGELIRRIVAADPSLVLPSTECNGLSTPALHDIDLDGITDYVYAGDLLGNMWKFDLTNTVSAQWDVYYRDLLDKPQPLFQAKSKNGFRQPITMKPSITKPCVFNGEGYMVIFGTGRFIGERDLDDVSVQTLYGIWDWGPAWKKAYDDAGIGDAEGKARRTYLGSFEDVLDDPGEVAACQSNCTTECENSGDVQCAAIETQCVDLCAEDETACDIICADDEAVCLDVCLDDLDVCNDACDPSPAGDACRADCTTDNISCDTACGDVRVTCESSCDSSKSSCESSCASEKTTCEGTVTSTYCPAAVGATDLAACENTCTNNYTACLVAAGGNTELQSICVDEAQLCQTSCNAYWQCNDFCGNKQRALSNIANIPSYGGASKAKYVTLLEQSQVWAGGINFYGPGEKIVNGEDYEGKVKEIVYNPDNWRDYDLYARVLTENQPTWFDFEQWGIDRITYPDQATNIGWYFDLTLTGERQVSDFLLNAGVVSMNSIIPSRSPCESGGNSFGQFLDYCSGGNVQTVFVDINGDLVIDENDTIDIGGPGGSYYIPISGILNQGIRSTPTLLSTRDGRGILINPGDGSDDDGTGGGTDGVDDTGAGGDSTTVEGPGYGMYFWREVGQ